MVLLVPRYVYLRLYKKKSKQLFIWEVWIWCTEVPEVFLKPNILKYQIIYWYLWEVPGQVPEVPKPRLSTKLGLFDFINQVQDGRTSDVHYQPKTGRIPSSITTQLVWSQNSPSDEKDPIRKNCCSLCPALYVENKNSSTVSTITLNKQLQG